MSKKDFKDGLLANSKTMEAFMQKQSDATLEVTNRVIRKIDENGKIIEQIVDELSNQEMKNNYCVYETLDIGVLDQSEKVKLLGYLNTLLTQREQSTDSQKKYFLNVKKYLNISGVSDNMNLMSVSELDITKNQLKVFFECVCEFLFLKAGTTSFLQDFDQEIDCFGFNNTIIYEILDGIERKYNCLGVDGIIDHYALKSNEQQTFYTDDKKTVNEDEIDNLNIESDDYSAIKKIIFDFSEVDQNNCSKSFGQLITDTARYDEIFEQMKLNNMSNEAVVAIFKAEQYLVFTTYGIYYEGWRSTVPYSELSKSELKIAPNVKNPSEQTLTIAESHDISDLQIDEYKLRDLIVDIIEKKEELLFSQTDKNTPFIKMDKQIHRYFLAAMVYATKKIGRLPIEVLRYFSDNEFEFSWGEVCEVADAITNAEDYKALVDDIFDMIAYPSKKSASAEMVALALKLYFYDQTDLKSPGIEYEMEQLIKPFDMNALSNEMWNSLCVTLFKELKYMQGSGNASEYVDETVKATKILKGAGLGLSVGMLAPVAMPFFTVKAVTTATAAVASYSNEKKKIDAKISSVEDVLKQHKNQQSDSYKKLINFLNENPIKDKEDYLKRANELFGEALGGVYDVEVDDAFSNAVLNDAPEMLFDCEKAEKASVSEKTLLAEKQYFEYKIKNALPSFFKASYEGCGRACYYLGEIYAWGYGGISKDKAAAKEWRKKGIERGDILSALNYAFMTTDSSLKEKTFSIALPQIEALANSGDVSAQYELSEMYYRGCGTAPNTEKGFYWLKKAAENGHWKAINKLACCHWIHRGGAIKDKTAAVDLWKKAANLGFEPAVYNIFKQKSLPEYKNKFDEICANGYAPALNYRAYLKLNEFNGYTKIAVSAYDDVRRAAERGDENAKKNYEIYKKKGKIGFFAFAYEFDPIY